MAEILRYCLVDRNGREADYEYDDFEAAKEDAILANRAGEPTAIIERTYSYDDSELTWTYDGSDAWPPEEEELLQCDNCGVDLESSQIGLCDDCQSEA